MPVGVLAQQTNELNTEEIDNPHILSPGDIIGPVGQADDLNAAHSELSRIMQQQSFGNFDTPDYPFILTAVDEEKGDLVVVMHAMAAMANIEYEEEAIAIALNTDVPIDIQYGVFVLEVSQSRIESWKQYYKDNCIPVKAGYQAVCKLYGDNLRKEGIDPDSLGSTSTVTPKPTLKSTSPCDENKNPLACYYYKRYQDKCIPTKTTTSCDFYATKITNAGYEVPTTKPATIVKVTPPKVTGVQAAMSGDDIKVTWNTPQYTVDKYRIYIYEDNKRVDREYIYTNSYTYDEVKKGKDYHFKVYVYYESNAKLTSIYGGSVLSNVVSVPAGTTITPEPNPKPTPPPTVKTNSTSIYGGNLYHLKIQNSTGIHDKTSTVAIGATNSTGSVGVVVSGHGIILPDDTVFAGHAFGDKHTLFSNSSVQYYYGPQVDAAFIPITEPNIVTDNKVQSSTGDIISVVNGTLSSVPLYKNLTIYGSQTNGKGALAYNNATTTATTYVLNNVGIALYPSTNGDSGAPITYNNDGTVEIVGVHHGGVCIFQPSSISDYKIDVSNLDSLCTPGDTYFKAFSAWEFVKETLSLQ